MGTSTAQHQSPSPSRNFATPPRRRSAEFDWILLAVLVAIGVYYLRYDLRAYAVLTRFADPRATGPLLRFETRAVTAEEVAMPTATGSVRARLYMPAGVAHPRGMVVVHGIHHLGIDEPRLENLSRAMAGIGFAVLTPEVAALADYHVDAASIATIGESAAWLDQRLGTGPVTVTGISFAGGLSLLAACDPPYAPHIRALILMGAYDDLSRVSRFLATNEEEYPDGRTVPYAAHDYGASVFVYARLAQFFPGADLPVAHEALRDWLWEQPDKAQPLLDKLSPPARATMAALLARRIEVVRPQMLNVIQSVGKEMAAVSPRGHIDNLRAPVFVLHGAEDNVIPPAESLWLGRDIPRADLRAVLITGAFSHADPKDHPPLGEELRLINFVASALHTAD